MQKKPNRSWLDNPRLALAFKIDKLLPGDTLISDSTGHQISCVGGTDTHDNPVKHYILLENGRRIARRRDPGSVLQHALRKAIPYDEVELVKGGAGASVSADMLRDEEGAENLW